MTISKQKYDANLIVIGAGSGGLVSAYIAAAVKAKVILIEKGEMGGDCLNTGCVPSKTLIASAKFVHNLKRASQYGFTSASVEFEFPHIMERVRTVIAQIAPHDSIERYTSLGVEVIKGKAELLTEHSVLVNGKTLTANSIVVAAGGEPLIPPIEGLDQIDYLTSDNVWNLTELPERLVVLGGGPIGCELAQCFARFGSDVHIVEMLPKIMIREDDEIAAYMTERLQDEGMHILTEHRAEKIVDQAGSKTLICTYHDRQVEVPFDQILVAVGRSARLDGYGLDNLHIPISPGRRIEVNDYLQAGYPSVYAVGDVVGPYLFTHAASHQAWYATVNALFRPFKKFKINYSVLPWATYTDPEIARVGFNEQEAKAQGIDYEVTRYDLGKLDRAIAEGHDIGTVKVLTVPGKDKILGVTIIGQHAGDLIAEFVLAMQHGLGLNKILGTIHAYPTWMEANKFAAGQWKRNHTPAWIFGLLRRFHQWRR